MATTFRAVFDGEVLRPEQPNGLRPATTYVITAEAVGPAEPESEAEGEAELERPYVLAELGRMAIDMGVDDLAARHDWYAHGRLPDDAEVAADGETESEPPYALAEIGRMAIDMGIEDFAARHDWYIHGRLPDDDPR